jgi:hypothetical protein
MSASKQPEPNTPVAMLWDFFGPNATKTAEHHRIHLGEFAASEQLTPIALEVLPMADKTTVSLVLPWRRVQELRPLLKPHRGQIWTKS